MKVFALALVLCLTVVAVESQRSSLFNRFFCRGSRASTHPLCVSTTPATTQKTTTRRTTTRRTTTPRTTTPRTTTPRTTTRRTNPPSGDCNPGKRKWSACTLGSPSTRHTTDSCRPTLTEECSEGRMIGSVFTDNFIAPPMDSGPSVVQPAVQGATLGGGGVGGRRFVGGAAAKGGCQVVNVTNSNGEVIFGACRRNNQNTGGGRSKRQIIQTKRDLLIMMDESGSVGSRRYRTVKRIAAAIVKLLCDAIAVHPDYTRVSIVSFDYNFRIHIRLSEAGRRLRYLDDDADALANYIIRRIDYHRSGSHQTCLIRAFERAYNLALDSSQGGRRGDPTVEQDIIIISDGCENCFSRRDYRLDEAEVRQRLIAQTDFFINQGIHVYVIGIGLRERCKEVLSLLAQGGRCFHFFYLTRWDYEVSDFLDQLENPPAGVCLNVFESPLMQCLDPLGR